MKYFLFKTFLILPVFVFCQYSHSPTQRQLNALDMEYYLFVHFGPNTFTNKEWGDGKENPSIFNPTSLDCEQWCQTAQLAGAKGIIITAKHHDGFCLWPSKYSTHTVQYSDWKKGTGDVLKELAKACKKYDLKMGVYLSPWDRNHPTYGTPEYNTVFNNMIKEVVTQYAPLWEFWFDGANGEGPNGKKQIYDWNLFRNTIRQLSPNTVMFSDLGPDLRWCGNENGIAGETNWNYINTQGYEPGQKAPAQSILNTGLENGAAFIPSECDVSIRDGWFYHPNDSTLKSAQELFQIYLKSVGRGANLLLNIPVNREGKMDYTDSIRLIEFKQIRDQQLGKSIFSTRQFRFEYNTQQKNYTTTILIPFAEKMNCLILEEDISMGQYIKSCSISALNNDNNTAENVTISTIGRKRIIPLCNNENHTFTQLKVTIETKKGIPQLKSLKGYWIDQKLTCF